jgi:hypothetical protein
VNFASDFLYARVVAMQTDEADDPVVVAAAAPDRLPITGLVRAPTGRWGQGRVAGTLAMSMSAESCTDSMAVLQR